MKARHPAARRSHMELAEAYDLQARNIAAEARRSSIRVVRSA